MRVNTYQVTGGSSDDYPEGAFDGVGVPSEPPDIYTDAPVYVFPDNEYERGIGRIFRVVINTNPVVYRWCITYGTAPSTPPPADCFITADDNIEGTYTPQGYWADSHADNLVVTMVPHPAGGYRWKSSTVNNVGSFEIYPPVERFQVGTDNFSISWWLKKTYSPGATLNYLHFILRTTSGVGPLIQLGLSLDNYPLRIWGFLSDYSIEPLPLASTFLDNFDWNNKDLLLVLTCDRAGLLKLYVNNNLVAQADATYFSATNFAPDIAAIVFGGTPNCYPGNTVEIDQFRFYKDIVLDEEQVSAIWNNGQGANVVKSEFDAIANDGLYIEFDDLTGYVPTCSALIAGVWTDNVPCPVEDYGFFYGMGFDAGGVPLDPPATGGVPLDPLTTGFAYNRIYRGQDGVIEENPVVGMGLNDSHVPIANQALPPDTIWNYVRRRVAPCGSESPDSPACIVRIDPEGEIIPTMPNQPLSVTACQQAGGKFLIRWRYTPIGHEITPTGFRIYADSGSGFNFASPTATVNYKLGGHGEFKWESGVYTHGQRIKFCVRAYAQGKGETQNTDYVAAVADAIGPDAITDVYATVEQLP
jgi:hypothetical protein